MKLWIARDLSGALCLFEAEPYLSIYKDWNSNESYFMIDENQFPEVTFENSPQEVELNLVKFSKIIMEKQLFNVMQGWQCPICKRVYSPFTHMCLYCSNKEIHTNLKPSNNTGGYTGGFVEVNSSNFKK